jgi:hypothetical protein
MKRLFYCLLISFLTFLVGLSVVWLTGILLFLLTPVENRPILYNDFPVGKSGNPIVETSNQKPRFTKTFRGCYFGYTQGYETDDGQQLSEGITGNVSRKKALTDFKKRIASSARVVERISGYKNHRGELGERVVLVNSPDDRNAEETISILWYGGGQFIAFVNAPSLDLALEFERFLKGD